MRHKRQRDGTHPPPAHPASPWMAPGLKALAEEWSGWPSAVLPFHNTHINVQTDSRGVEGRAVVIMPLMEGETADNTCSTASVLSRSFWSGTWEGLQPGDISVAQLKGHFATALRGLHFFQERDISIFDVKERRQKPPDELRLTLFEVASVPFLVTAQIDNMGIFKGQTVYFDFDSAVRV